LKNPTFANPPVSEVVIGLFFSPIATITNAHFGKFWEKNSEIWVSARDQNPIPIQLEEFGDTSAFGRLGLQISSDPSSRVQLFSRDRSRLLQMQREGFFYNWKKIEAEDYPRFQALRGEFFNHFENYSDFVLNETETKINPLQWEVTYVNSIRKGELWNSVSDWKDIIEGPFGFPPSSLPISVESAASNWSYVIGENLGRLRASISHAQQNSDLLVVKLSTRGPILNSIEEGIETGHSTIVNYFEELTSNRAHQFWNLQNDV